MLNYVSHLIWNFKLESGRGYIFLFVLIRSVWHVLFCANVILFFLDHVRQNISHIYGWWWDLSGGPLVVLVSREKFIELGEKIERTYQDKWLMFGPLYSTFQCILIFSYVGHLYSLIYNTCKSNLSHNLFNSHIYLRCTIKKFLTDKMPLRSFLPSVCVMCFEVLCIWKK